MLDLRLDADMPSDDASLVEQAQCDPLLEQRHDTVMINYEGEHNAPKDKSVRYNLDIISTKTTRVSIILPLLGRSSFFII